MSSINRGKPQRTNGPPILAERVDHHHEFGPVVDLHGVTSPHAQEREYRRQLADLARVVEAVSKEAAQHLKECDCELGQHCRSLAMDSLDKAAVALRRYPTHFDVAEALRANLRALFRFPDTPL